jgi:hypothetical protein
MVSKCLNSGCSATFRYLGQGRLYCMDFAAWDRHNLLAGKKVVTSIRSKVWPIEYFWLCERCAATMTIGLSDAGEVQLVPVEVSGQNPAVLAAPPTNATQDTRFLKIHPSGLGGEVGMDRRERTDDGTGCDLPDSAAG